MSVQHELGPAMLSRAQLYARAREVNALSALVLDRTREGPQQDLPAARGAMDRILAVLGVSSGPGAGTGAADE